MENKLLLSKVRNAVSGNKKSEIIALSAAAVVNVYLAFLVVDANTGYNIGISELSPLIRACSISVIGIVLLWMIVSTRSLKLNFTIVSLGAYIVFGTLVGGVKNGLTYEFFRHLFAGATMFTAYWAGRFLQFEGLEVYKALRFWGWVSIACGVGAWVIGFGAIENVAFSMSPVTQILPLSFGVATGSIVMAVVAFCMIAFGNKRDVIIGAAVIFSVALMRKYFAKLNFYSRVCIGSVIAIIISILIFSSVSQATKVVAYMGVLLPENLAERSNRVVGFFDEEDVHYKRAPLSGNLAERSNRIVEFADEEKAGIQDGIQKTIEDDLAPPQDLDSLYWKLERFTSSRLSLAASVYRSVVNSEYGYVFGKGFGGSYSWRYWSENNASWENYVFYQSDLMPLWFFLTSGTLIAAMVLGAVIWNLVRIFNYTSRTSIEVPALLVLGGFFSMLLSFQPNVPFFWLFLGAMSARIDDPR